MSCRVIHYPQALRTYSENDGEIVLCTADDVTSAECHCYVIRSVKYVKNCKIPQAGGSIPMERVS